MLTKKLFGQRFEIANELEKDYLERYFGLDQELVAFAKILILSGNKEAALKLNKYISVLGSNVNSKSVINRIKQDYFSGGDPKYDGKKDAIFVQDLHQKYAKLKTSRDIYLALDLARLMNYKIEEEYFLFKKIFNIQTGPNAERMQVLESDFVDWVLNEFKNI